MRSKIPLPCFRFAVAAATVFATFAMWMPDTFGMPMFARKYQTACTTCHVPFPKLNAVGEAFRLNGYKMPGGDAAYVKDEPVSMGSEAYKRVFPKAVWPSDIPGMPPIAIRFLGDTNIDTGGTADNHVDFDFPHEVELFGAGSFGDRSSFFVEVEIEGGEVETEGWIQFEDLVANTLGENHLNIKAGVLGAKEFGTPNARDGERFQKEHYLYANYRIPGSENTYRIRDGQPGIELNSFDARWKAAVGVVEGDGNTSDVDVYTQVAAKLGGTGFDGSAGPGKEGELGGDSSGYWRDDSITVGFFGYWGKGQGVAGGAVSDDFYRLGFDARANWMDLSIAAGYLWGNNDDPFGTSEEVDSSAWFAEANYWILPWVTPIVRVESQDIDLPTGTTDDKRTRVVAGVNFLIRANVRLLLEGVFHTEDTTKAEDNDRDLVALRFDFAF